MNTIVVNMTKDPFESNLSGHPIEVVVKAAGHYDSSSQVVLHHGGQHSSLSYPIGPPHVGHGDGKVIQKPPAMDSLQSSDCQSNSCTCSCEAEMASLSVHFHPESDLQACSSTAFAPNEKS
jgi:hypothetical protein